ncbi:MAG TPA: GlmU family protein [Bacteroidota bacterium]|nr:GlmU family protein [Bacteroidota bacterium]
MASTVCLFEDALVSNFFPLVYFRPVYDLRCGITTLREKIRYAYPSARMVLLCRSYLADALKAKEPNHGVNKFPLDRCLLINGRVLADKNFSLKIPLSSKNDIVYVKGDTVVAAFVHGKALEKIAKNFTGIFSHSDFEGLPQKEVDVELVKYPWELVHANGAWIEKDFRAFVPAGKKIRGKVHTGVHIIGKKNVSIDSGAVIKPGAVLDAEEGPIYIGKKVQVFPNAVIVGPAAIEEGSMIKAGAQIYENTTIGPVCKVGGEVEESILQSYSNKQHAGFLGHSYLGSWVNLGADTNNSDLKNNYGSVKVPVNGSPVDTGLQFVGVTIGDHSKSGINTMFNTGTVVGVCSNVFGSGFPVKSIPSFVWGSTSEISTYELEKAIAVAKQVMNRRNVKMNSEEETLFRIVFEMTIGERKI